jgi:uncharacterized protein YecE (DUF72 family)
MQSNIRVGTSSWTDPTLIACGRFYPADVTTPEQRLRFYASRFPIVEVDSSYYAMPDPQVAHRWASRTPADFIFNIKAFRLFTGHQTPPAALPVDIRHAMNTNKPMLYYRDVPGELRDELWRRFMIAVEPLRMTGKLGAIHFQFAPWVQHNARNIAHIEHCASQMQEHTMAIELRDQSWFEGGQAAATLALERELGAVHVVVDSPQGFANTVPDVWETTHPHLAIIRLHGRNTAAWNNKSGASSGRFVYEYSPEELAQIAERIRRMAKAVTNAHVLLNTNFEDQGVRNAGKLRNALATLPS